MGGLAVVVHFDLGAAHRVADCPGLVLGGLAHDDFLAHPRFLGDHGFLGGFGRLDRAILEHRVAGTDGRAAVCGSGADAKRPQ